MSLKINEIDCEIKFKHDVEVGSTICVVKCNDEIFIGTSTVHERDNYSKEVGRKLTLSRALSKSHLNKEKRTFVWDNYRNWNKKRF